MSKMNSMKSLFLHELKDIYSAEKQLVDNLPKIRKKVSSTKLKTAIDMHFDQTKKQVDRVEEVFRALGERPEAIECHAMVGLLEECKEVEKEKPSSEVLDAAIIAAQQKIEHYEIAAYGTLAAWAEQMGDGDTGNIRILLEQTLDEEKKADQILSEIALETVNRKAS